MNGDNDGPDRAGQDVTGKAKLAGDETAASACLALGVFSMFTWMVPLLGMVAPIVGLAVGWRGLRATNRDRARLGLVLCTIASLMCVAVIYWLFIFVDTFDDEFYRP